MDIDSVRNTWRDNLLMTLVVLSFLPSIFFAVKILIERSGKIEAWIFASSYASLVIINLLFKEMNFLKWVFGKTGDEFFLPSLKTSVFSFILCGPLFYKILPKFYLELSSDSYFMPLYVSCLIVACLTQILLSFVGYRLSGARDRLTGKYLKEMTVEELALVDMNQFK